MLFLRKIVAILIGKIATLTGLEGSQSTESIDHFDCIRTTQLRKTVCDTALIGCMASGNALRFVTWKQPGLLQGKSLLENEHPLYATPGPQKTCNRRPRMS